MSGMVSKAEDWLALVYVAGETIIFGLLATYIIGRDHRA